jgi:hypothetical protein
MNNLQISRETALGALRFTRTGRSEARVCRDNANSITCKVVDMLTAFGSGYAPVEQTVIMQWGISQTVGQRAVFPKEVTLYILKNEVLPRISAAPPEAYEAKKVTRYGFYSFLRQYIIKYGLEPQTVLGMNEVWLPIDSIKELMVDYLNQL